MKELDPRRTRVLTGIVGVLMLVFVLFSAFYIAAEANHDCSDDDCPVCACVRMCENTLRGVGGTTRVRSVPVAPVILVFFAAGLVVAAVSHDTLVSRKIRIND